MPPTCCLPRPMGVGIMDVCRYIKVGRCTSTRPLAMRCCASRVATPKRSGQRTDSQPSKVVWSKGWSRPLSRRSRQGRVWERGGGGGGHVSHGVSNETDAPVSGAGPIRSCGLRWTAGEAIGVVGVWVEVPQAGLGIRGHVQNVRKEETKEKETGNNNRLLLLFVQGER